MKPQQPTIRIGAGENAPTVTLGELLDKLAGQIDASKFKRDLRRAILETFTPQRMAPLDRAAIAIKTTEGDWEIEMKPKCPGEHLRVTGVTVTASGGKSQWRIRYTPEADRLEV